MTPTPSRSWQPLITVQHPLTPALLLALAALVFIPAQAQQSKSQFASEPGSFEIEGVLPKPIKLTVLVESIIYYQSDLQRALGGMAPGTTVQLLAITDTAWKVRGRARHGDVAGWMKITDLKSPDPKLTEKLKAYCERKRIVEQLIEKRQIAVGLTVEEVKASLGRPDRKSFRIVATSREETYEYSIYKSVPQAVTSRDKSGNLVQNIIYVKVETGRLSVSFRDGNVTEIQETQGNTLIPGGEVKIVPGPIIVF